MIRSFLTLLAVLATPAALDAASTGSLQWTPLPALPDNLGVAGPFVGTHNGALLVAGGANFPEKLPWEGGTKVWHDTVFVLEKPDAAWKVAGKLPRPLGYGASLSTKDDSPVERIRLCAHRTDFVRCDRMADQPARARGTGKD